MAQSRARLADNPANDDRKEQGMHSLTMARKLWAALGITWLAILLLMGWMNWQNRQTIQQERQDTLRHMVTAVQHQLAALSEQVRRGELSLAQAQNRGLETIASVRFGDGDYLFAFDSDMRMLVHPVFERGADMRDYQDSHGNMIFHLLMDVVRKQGNGFVLYNTTRAGGDEDLTKLTFMDVYAPWNWYIGTGVYLDDIDTAFRASLWRSLMILLVIGIPMTAMMGWIIRDITRRLGGDPAYAAEVVRHIADGDLTRATHLPAGDHDSLLFHINRMRESLLDTIRAILHSADDVNSAVLEIRGGNDELATRTEQQAASLAETASSMEQITATVKQNADHAEHARRLAGTTEDRARAGRGSMEQVIELMQAITQSARQMSSIVDTIDGIAFQTNILALNASVEAARAGEQGRGFAVVASEVRNLASRSAEAAREIKTLIEGAHTQVTQGSRQVQETGDIIAGMSHDMTQLNTLISEISTASTEQSHGIGQVNQAVTQMDQMTQQNASLVQESSHASEKLATLSRVMRERASRFRVND